MKLSDFMLFALMRNQKIRIKMTAMAIKKKIPQFIGRNIAKEHSPRWGSSPYFKSFAGLWVVLNHPIFANLFFT
ncbi:MAG: hypothetical protein J6U20_12060 [Fibrobacter sp.]|nr:hypothetical protein [Fibrobacter sp.]